MSPAGQCTWADVLCGLFDTRDRDWLCEAHATRIPDLRNGDDGRRGRSARLGADVCSHYQRPAEPFPPRRGAARLIAAAILAGAALIGDRLLRTLSIGLPAFRIAGGLLLFSIASEMVFGVRIERQSKEAEEVIEERVRNIAAFPLAIPLMAGPGAIAATILLAGRANGDPVHLGILLAVVAAVLGLCFVVFLLAAHIATLVGTTVSVVLSRLLGVVLAALAVQFVIDGVRTALAG
jgi:multiple antibiotic resistance protein